MPKNSPWEETHHGWSTSYIVLVREQGNKKTNPQVTWATTHKTEICADLRMTKYITYITTYKYDIKSIHKMMEFTKNDWGKRDITKIIITLNKQGIPQP